MYFFAHDCKYLCNLIWVASYKGQLIQKEISNSFPLFAQSRSLVTKSYQNTQGNNYNDNIGKFQEIRPDSDNQLASPLNFQKTSKSFPLFAQSRSLVTKSYPKTQGKNFIDNIGTLQEFRKAAGFAF